MVNLIKLDTQEYPVSVEEFMRRFPNTSFPVQIPFNDFGYAVVFPTPPSLICTVNQRPHELHPILTAKGHYEQRWEIVALHA